MRIQTPNPDSDEPILKDVVVGGGVRIRLEGTRYLSDATVLSINEDADQIGVRGVGFEATVNSAAIIDAYPPDERTYQEIFENQIDAKATQTFNEFVEEVEGQ